MVLRTIIAAGGLCLILMAALLWRAQLRPARLITSIVFIAAFLCLVAEAVNRQVNWPRVVSAPAAPKNIASRAVIVPASPTVTAVLTPIPGSVQTITAPVRRYSREEVFFPSNCRFRIEPSNGDIMIQASSGEEFKIRHDGEQQRDRRLPAGMSYRFKSTGAEEVQVRVSWEPVSGPIKVTWQPTSDPSQ